MGKKISNKLIILMAIACAFSVANLYYAQPILNLIANDYHMSQTTTSLVVTLTQIGYAVGIILITPFADIVSKRKMILLIIPLCIVSLILFVVAPNSSILLISSFLIGIFCVTQQLIIPFVAELSTNENRGYNIGKVMSGLLIGILLSRTFSGVISSVLNWKYVYIISALLLIIIELLLFIMLPKTNVTDDSKTYFKIIKTMPNMVRNNKVLKEASINGFTMFMVFNIAWSTLIFYLQDMYGYGSIVAGLLGIAGVAGVIVAPKVGKKNDIHDSRKIINHGMKVVLFSFILLLLFGWNMLMLIISLVLLDLGIQMCLITNQTRIHNGTNEDRSRVNSIFVFFYFLGGALGSTIGIFIYSHFGWSASCLFAIVLILIGYIINNINMRRINKNHYSNL